VLATSFCQTAGASLIHVPYRDDAPALTDLLGGQVQAYFRHHRASSVIKARLVDHGGAPLSSSRAEFANFPIELLRGLG
jgi:hypothetical protein